MTSSNPTSPEREQVIVQDQQRAAKHGSALANKEADRAMLNDGFKPRNAATGQYVSSENNDRENQEPHRVTLEDINIDKPPKGKSWAKVIDSPRSLEAFKRAGIFAQELDPVDVAGLESALKRRFGAKSTNQDLLYLRVEHANKNRHSKFNMVKSERESIIFEENNWFRNTTYGGGGGDARSNAFASYRTKSADDEKSLDSIESSEENNGRQPRNVRFGMNQTVNLPGGRNGGREKFSSITSHDSNRSPLTHKNSDGAAAFGFNTLQSINSATSGAMRQSTMIEQEKRALLKIKERQKRELEMMLEQEVKMQEINERNAKKQQLQKEKEERRRIELELKAKAHEEQVAKKEAIMREKAEAEARIQRDRNEQLQANAEKQAKKQRAIAAAREAEATRKEIELEKKLAQKEMDQAKQKAEAEQAVQERQASLARRETQRKEYMDKVKAEKQRIVEIQRAQKDELIRKAKEAQESQIKQQREEFMTRSARAEIKQQEFQRTRQASRRAAVERAMRKTQEMRKALQLNEELQEERKQQILFQQSIAEKRKRKLERQKYIEIKKKQIQAEVKAKHSEEVRILTDRKAEQRKKQLVDMRLTKETSLQRTQAQKEYEMMIKRELRDINREEREANVERIVRQRDYQKTKVMDGIAAAEKRTQSLMAEKKSILDMRMETRREADKTKREITLKVEKVRSKGFKPSDFAELGYLGNGVSLNEQSVIIDEKDEFVGTAANSQAGPFRKTGRHEEATRRSAGKDRGQTPESQERAEARFTNQALNVDSQAQMEDNRDKSGTEAKKQKQANQTENRPSHQYQNGSQVNKDLAVKSRQDLRAEPKHEVMETVGVQAHGILQYKK